MVEPNPVTRLAKFLFRAVVGLAFGFVAGLLISGFLSLIVVSIFSVIAAVEGRVTNHEYGPGFLIVSMLVGSLVGSVVGFIKLTGVRRTGPER